ncbi:MAG: hypothetical protein ABFS56_11680 [Pseudomonadota bacterium]
MLLARKVKNPKLQLFSFPRASVGMHCAGRDFLSEEYQQNFKQPGIIGYYKLPYELEPKEKTY